jgi:phosphoribosylanthranilate isomerase
MKVKIKICGMRDPVNILAVAETKPDYLGFIYYNGSPRFVGPNFQAPGLDNGIKRVGVFVNQSLEVIVQEMERNKLDAVQLHGHESPGFCFSVKSMGIEVIKAFSIDANFDFDQTASYQEAADFFLFDTRGKNFGGTGIAFDWSLLKAYKGSTPFFLSGGLYEQNISQLASIEHPSLYAIDLNSGVEDAPGVKSVQRIKNIIETVKSL